MYIAGIIMLVLFFKSPRSIRNIFYRLIKNICLFPFKMVYKIFMKKRKEKQREKLIIQKAELKELIKRQKLQNQMDKLNK